MLNARAAASARLPRWVGRAVSITTTVLLIAVSLLALFTVVIPLVMGAQSYTVLTGSMRPGLEPGTLIAVRQIDPAEIRAGDVITYQLEPGRPEVVTHRVVGLNVSAGGETTFITRGDANNVDDALPVLPVQVRGVVVYAVPWLGHLNLLLQGTQKSILVIVAGIAAIGYGVVVLTRDAATSRRKKRQRVTAAPTSARTSVSTAVALVGAACLALTLGPAPTAAAAEPPSPGAPEALQLSTDGITWISDGTLDLFDVTGSGIVPGPGVTSRLWVRNTTSDPATFALTASWASASTTLPSDAAVARDLTVSFDAGPGLNGVEWVGGRLTAGGVRTVDVRVALAAASANDSRLGQATLHGSVRLTELVDDGPVTPPSALPTPSAPPPVSPAPEHPLAMTGGQFRAGAFGLAGVTLLAGVALLVRARRRRAQRER